LLEILRPTRLKNVMTMELGLSWDERVGGGFLEEHRQIERLFERLLAAFSGDDRGDVAHFWSECDRALSKHLRDEEEVILPRLFSARPREARAIVAEHQHLRARMADLRMQFDGRTLRLENARGFLEELQAHARHEERVLYPEAAMAAAERDSHIDPVCDGPGPRPLGVEKKHAG
jgi:hemerythrin-like domain-containing protein